jgi:hypothetical protein
MTRTTISSRLENLFGCKSDSARFTACLVATGHAHEHTCPRCGGTGIFGHYGVCFNCQAQPARMRSWRTPRLTKVLEAEVAKRWPLVSHLIGNGSTFSAIARESRAIERWARFGGPLTPAEWVEREGYRVATRLAEIAATAADDREYAEAAAARQAKQDAAYAKRDAEQGYGPVPVTDERVALVGTVVKTRTEPGYAYGEVTKALIAMEIDGAKFKLWGTLPAAIDDAQEGDRVSFTARIKASDKDANFGFWSRPTKATIDRPEPQAGDLAGLIIDPM